MCSRAKIDRFQSFGVASLTAEFDVSLVMRADFDSSHARRCVCALRFDYLAGAAILLVSAKIDVCTADTHTSRLVFFFCFSYDFRFFFDYFSRLSDGRKM